jgi:cell division protein ZipA
MKSRRQDSMPNQYKPSLGSLDNKAGDDIIAVRKLSDSADAQPVDDETDGLFFDELTEDESAQEIAYDAFEMPEPESNASAYSQQSSFRTSASAQSIDEEPASLSVEPKPRRAATHQAPADKMVVMFLLAKENRQFVGYELLQTLLASGLRFGEGYLFHRHQLPNGQGPIIFSLASATASGIFDLQNIGAFSARGLCLFMQTSGNASIDLERFNILYETARQLSEGLDAHLLDEKREPLTKEGLIRYQRALGGVLECEASA